MGRIISRPFDYDPATGIREVFHHDLDTDEVVIETIQGEARRGKGAIDLITDVTKENFANTDERARWRDGMNHVASIPLVFLQQHPELMHDDEALKKWLNSSENRIFRSRPGRI